MTAVRNLLLKSFGISAAAAALAVFGYSAQVQAQAAKKEEPKAAAGVHDPQDRGGVQGT